MLKSLTALRLVIGAVKRQESATKRTRRKNTKREEKRAQKGANYAKNADTKYNTKIGMPIVTSELGTKYIDERMLNKIRQFKERRQTKRRITSRD